MAEGRMLSKRVSRSEKIASLSSDTSRMIYTWLIPYLDVEGRMEANPKLLKSDVAPMLDHITPNKIQAILEELHGVGLIILYTIECTQYLQLTKFEVNQRNLRKDKERPSDVPGPDQGRTYSGPTPDLLRPKDAIREEKRREAKLTRAREGQKPKPPLKENQKANGGNGDGKNHIKEMAFLVDRIREKYPDARYNRDVMMFIESNVKAAHPGAIIHCLQSLLDNPKTVQAPRPYLEAALKVENGKYNARDHEAEAKARGDGLMPFSEIMAEIERRREHT